jgi:hypothetical protein
MRARFAPLVPGEPSSGTKRRLAPGCPAAHTALSHRAAGHHCAAAKRPGEWEHRAVLREDVHHERMDAARGRDVDQSLGQGATEAAAVVVVDHADRELGDGRIGDVAHGARPAGARHTALSAILSAQL